MLQTRAGKRTAAAAVKVAVDLTNEGIITREEALMRVEPGQAKARTGHDEPFPPLAIRAYKYCSKIFATVRYTYIMTHTLADILANRFNEEPAEIQAIKKYIKDNLDQSVAVAINGERIIITARTAAQAGSLRPHLFNIGKQCQTQKQLFIRIG